MPEMWAQCHPCDRWFFVPFDSGERMSQARCPVCSSEASLFEVRIEESAFPVEMMGDSRAEL